MCGWRCDGRVVLVVDSYLCVAVSIIAATASTARISWAAQGLKETYPLVALGGHVEPGFRSARRGDARRGKCDAVVDAGRSICVRQESRAKNRGWR